MKKKNSRLESTTPLPRIPVNELITEIKGELKLTYTAMAAISGPGYTTLQNWAEGSSADQIEALIRLLARIPEVARHRIVDAACPVMPSLAHKYIARDRMMAASLRGLLRNEHGITLVLGQSDYQRTFLATALAHSFAAENPKQVSVSGYDVHEPNWFVPIDGVTYLDVWKRPNGHEAIFQNRRVEPARMVFLNGLYSRVPRIRPDLQKLGASCHVLIAEKDFPARELASFQGPKHVVTVSLDRSVDSDDDASRMLINVRDASANHTSRPKT